MRIAAFNVENLFERAKAFELGESAEGKQALADFSRLTDLIQKSAYTAADKSEMLAIMARHPGLAKDGESKFLQLRANRGAFLYKPKEKKPIEIVAQGRGDWIGWFDLKRVPVDETATRNTARVIDLVDADVLCVVEAEDRVGLSRFNKTMLPAVGGKPYAHAMLVDGNDDRGIDVGVLTRAGYRIANIRSHVDDKDAQGEIFSRDCAEYEIATPNGNTILLLVNHFKSKRGGKESAAKRLRQARRVRQIVNARIEAYPYLCVLGDLNETPDQPPLAPLLAESPKLIDIFDHPKFVGDGRPGTYANGTKSNKLDYILMSPQLADKVSACSIERRGVWGGTNGTLFPHLPEIESAKDAASDHAALWADFDL
jgi:endonuclease/exonuclease/phosphatase family metal-dependent hydrolase